MNICTFTGVMATEPDIRKISGKDGKETTVARFTIAVNRPYNKNAEKQEADFLRCVAWNGTAEFIERNFSKGRRLALETTVRTHVYENQDNNTKQTVTEFFVTNVEALGPKTSSDEKSTSNTKAEPTATPKVEDAYSDELPF